MLDLLFPPRCIGCGAPGGHLCPRCLPHVAVLTPPWCARCGRPAEEPLASCADCPPGPVDLARAPFLYGGPMARAVRGLKFSGWRALAPRLAAAMVEVLGTGMSTVDAGAVTWVPLSRRRRASRGFDQAEVLARAVARRSGLPAVRLLRRLRETPAQAARPGPARRRALRGAFEPVGRAPARVILVDDVLTTGATAAACARALRAGGAGAVVVLTAARAIGGPLPARCLGVPGEARPAGPGAEGGTMDAGSL